jgi:DNA-binding CsgD family transcriptional regulator
LLLGRLRERAAIERALERAKAGSSTSLVLVGPPGIGKSALLAAAEESARGFECARLGGFEPEAALPWAGLASLLAAWPALAAADAQPLRDAIAGLRVPSAAIGAALHAGIVRRSAERPLLLLVDDVQWLDPPTTEALAFALRRLGADRVAVVAARRDDSPPSVPGDELAIGALDRSDSLALLRAHLELPADVADRCAALAAGNPLALLHLASSLTPDQRRGLRPVDAIESLPQQLGATFRAKLAALPDATRRALVVIAAGSGDGMERALAALGASVSDLLAAETAGILALDPRPRLLHPLWAAAILDSSDAALRRRANAALADHASDPDRAALHRASSAERPSEEIASEVEGLALRCARRGVPALAARAWADAARLSPDATARRRRALIAAQAFWDASLPDAANELLSDLMPALTDANQRAEAVVLHGQIAAFTRDARGASLALRAEAARGRGLAPSAELALYRAATVAALLAADARLGVELARRGVAAAPSGTHRVAAQALLGYAAVHLGDGSEREAIARIEGLATAPSETLAGDPIDLLHLVAWVLLVRGKRAECERALRQLLAEAARLGLVSEQAFAEGVLAELDFRRGRWLDAIGVATAGDLDEAPGSDLRGALRNAVAAHVLAQLGDADACAQRAGRALRAANACGLASIASFARTALGASALAQGNARAAADALWPVWETRLRGGVAEPGVTWYQGDVVEALLALGRRADAAAIVADVAESAAATRNAWAQAAAARGAALLGEGGAGEALAAAQALDAPFELARTQLALVEHGVSAPRDARLSDALATFERLGARPWAERTRARLGAGGASEDSLARLLSEAELRVALLVARGATNAEIGEQLVLSVRTVDAHLRTIFRKLGISRRTQLALRVSRERGSEH